MTIPPVDIRAHALLLDVDGTILDISEHPYSVVVPPELRDTLERLSRLRDGAVAFVSGRPIADLDRLFAPLVLPAVGGHGAEIRIPGSVPLIKNTELLDATLRAELSALAALGPGILIEDKGYSVAVHYRQRPELRATLLDRIATLSAEHRQNAVELLPGKAMIEIKRPAYNKGTGVRLLMAHPPFAGRRPVFIGDDVTDEAAFAVMPEFGGIGLSVGRAMPGLAGQFPSPAALRIWLRDLVTEAEAA